MTINEKFDPFWPYFASVSTMTTTVKPFPASQTRRSMKLEQPRPSTLEVNITEFSRNCNGDLGILCNF